MRSKKARKRLLASYRRKPVSSVLDSLQFHWPPVFTGVTGCYDRIKMQYH